MGAISAVASQVQSGSGMSLDTGFIRSAVSGISKSKVTGINETAGNFEKLKSASGGETLDKAVEPQAQELIDEIEKNIREEGIVSDSGNGKQLKDNIEMDATIDKNDNFQLEVGPTQDVFYGLFWEFGFTLHSFTGEKIDKAPKPFMRPAADKKGDDVADGIKNNLLDKIEAVAESEGLELQRGI